MALDSQDVQRLQQLAAVEGLQLKKDRPPLRFQLEENGQRVYTADRQGVAFVGERKGRRIYEVALGFEPATRLSDQPVIWPALGKQSVREASLILALVDAASQEILKVVWMDIGSMARNGERSIVIHNPDGQRSRYLMSENGVARETTKNGLTRLENVPLRQQPCTMQPNDVTCSLVCGFTSLFSCAIITAATGGLLTLICGSFAVWMCAMICG